MTPSRRDDEAGRKSIFDAVMRAIACDECDAEVRVVESTPGVHHVIVAHDDDCPAYGRMERTASTPWN